MRHLFFVLLLFQSSLAFGQTEPPRKWWVGGTASPELAYRSLFTTAAGGTLKEYLNGLEGPVLGFSVGATAVYQKNERVSLESGLFFSHGGYREKKWRDLIWTIPEPTLPIRARFADRVDYLNLPVKVNFSPFKKHTKFFVSTATLLQMRLTAKTISCFEYTDGHTEKTKSDIAQQTTLNDFSLALQVGFGWQKVFGSRHRLQIEPFFRHMVTPFNGGVHAKYYFYSSGLRVTWVRGL